MAGTILAGHPVRQACTRHLRDLADGAARGLRWSLERAAHALAFFPQFLRLHEGEHAGQPFTLAPWQAFIIGSLFGWLTADGSRRFRTAYIEAGKGNGKTPLLAGVGLYGLVADGEAGAQIYPAAVTREQAGLLFADAKAMAAASPSLAARLEILEHNLADPVSGSFFRPVSSEGRSLDGKRVHMALIDEIHEHPDATVVDKLRAGTKGRRQAIICEITNSGHDRHSVCWQHHEYSLKVLDQVLDNDAWFAYVCALDPCGAHASLGVPQEGCADCDDWQAPATWPKANPNLGVSVTEKYLAEQVREAQDLPGKRAIVRRLNFCAWTESEVRWLAPEAWAACGAPVDPEALRGRPCIAGLDLSTKIDLTALVLLFPRDDDDDPASALADGPRSTRRYDVLCHFWAPAETVAERVRRDRVPYDLWARQGHLELTDGNVIDHRAIRARVLEYASRYDIREVAYDPYSATMLVSDLQDDGLPCVEVRQGAKSLGEATKQLEVLVRDRGLRHGQHPVLRWCAANVVVELDRNGNYLASKRRSTERIDGISALITALARAMVQGDARSVYESRGVLAV